jgi:hypothetical protein
VEGGREREDSSSCASGSTRSYTAAEGGAGEEEGWSPAEGAAGAAAEAVESAAESSEASAGFSVEASSTPAAEAESPPHRVWKGRSGEEGGDRITIDDEEAKEPEAEEPEAEEPEELCRDAQMEGGVVDGAMLLDWLGGWAGQGWAGQGGW